MVSRGIALLFLLAAAALPAQTPGRALAPTPPLGWNSWDAYGTTVRESEVKANADFMAARLAPLGWRYIVVDIEWYATHPKSHGYIPGGDVSLDAYGRFTPSVERFPSAANGAGFRPLADSIHAQGLQFGIHIMRGIPRRAVDENLPIEGSRYRAAEIADRTNVCRWKGMEDTYGVDMSKPGAQDYYDSLARLYASWGVDLVKADDMSQPFQAAEIHAFSTALGKTGRPIVLSLSPGPAPLARHSELRANAEMWRISNDFWDSWPKLREQFGYARAWERWTAPGSWPDADMLPLGRIGLRAEVGEPRETSFTTDEQQTLVTLWSLARSPLMYGGDLPSSSPADIALISNPEVLAVDQHSMGSREAFRSGSAIAWLAGKPGSHAKYLAVFNVGDAEQRLHLRWAQVGIPGRAAAVRDLWVRRELGLQRGLDLALAPHASVLYAVIPR